MVATCCCFVTLITFNVGVFVAPTLILLQQKPQELD